MREIQCGLSEVASFRLFINSKRSLRLCQVIRLCFSAAPELAAEENRQLSEKKCFTMKPPEWPECKHFKILLKEWALWGVGKMQEEGTLTKLINGGNKTAKTVLLNLTVFIHLLHPTCFYT